MSPEQRARISLRMRGNQNARGHRNSLGHKFTEEQVIRRAVGRGLDPARAVVANAHPRHNRVFRNTLRRVALYGFPCDFPDTAVGLQAFIDYLGPVPESMTKPSVGRIDHANGYVRGNFMWQEFSENASEAALRTGLGRNVGNGRKAAP